MEPIGATSDQHSEITRLSISAAAGLLQRRALSPVELTLACLARIEQLNPSLNAFITLTAESALAEAHAAEKEILAGNWRGPLHGIPIGLKDLIDTAGVRTTCGSALFADRVPEQDAYIVKQLKQAGAVLLGKQNMQEFAYGGTSAASHYGAVRNPWDVTRIAGGSSGGSAAAVAAGMCFGAIGSDTGGSIRQPAAYCGIAGLMPSYGRVSTRGAFPLSWSLDHLGPLCRNVRDTALLLEVIAGYDALDPASVDHPVEPFTSALDTAPVAPRIGLVRQPFHQDLDPEIASAFDQALQVIATLGASFSELELPAVPTNVVPPEAYTAHKQYLQEAPEQYLPWTRERLLHGASVSASDYIAGRRQLEQLRRSIGAVFSSVDLLLTPTTPVQPITLAQATSMVTPPPPPGEVWLRNTRLFNSFALPTISVPCGFTRAGLPIGLQITGPRFAEAQLLSFAHAFERATNWHTRAPAM